MTIQQGKQLKKIRTELQATQKEFAEELRIPFVTYRGYEQDKRRLPYELLTLISNKYRIDLTWLLTGTGEMFLKKSEPKQEINNILELDIKIDPLNLVNFPVIPVDCGTPISEHPDIYQYMPWDKSTLPFDMQKMIIFRASGKSMEPTILDEDIIIAVRSTTWKNGNVVVCKIGNERTCKRINLIDNKIVLSSDNKEYGEIIIESQEWEILAVVKRIEREI